MSAKSKGQPGRIDTDVVHWKGVNWQRGYARKAAVCAISGRPIASGDLMYRPAWGVAGIRKMRVAASTWDK